MINRVLIRTRALQVAYAQYHSGEQNVTVATNELKSSLERTYSLYLLLLRLPVDLTNRYGQLVEIRRKKHFASEQDLNPNLRLLENRFVAKVASSEVLNTWYATSPLTWSNYPELLRHLVERIEASEAYQMYLNAPETFESDRDLWFELISSVIANDRELSELLETEDLYWDDELAQIEKIECEEHPGWEAIDNAVSQAREAGLYSAQRFEHGNVEIIKDFVKKSIHRTEAQMDFHEVIMPMYRDPEDETFAMHLLRQVLLGYDRSVELIEQNVSTNWDKERLADMDILLIQMAIAEFLHFPQIPTSITINEYVELSKHYSTPKSSIFVNGVLDAIVKQLKAEGKILKV